MVFDTLVGQTLGQYHLVALLGQGGMGAVYKAVQTSLGRDVAVKVMASGLADQPGFLERFNREARLAASLHHPHIITIHDFGAVQNLTFVVMQFLNGGSLEQRMRQRVGSPPSLGEIVHLLNGVASALDYAHSRNVIHRDIKPANIVFDDGGKAYLVDFGIAKMLDATNAGLTGTGTAMGSPSYMPPEQWQGEEVKPASDQYALAITVYNVLTGRLPFEATNTPALMYKHLQDDPTPIHTIRPDLPTQTMTVLGRAMAKKPQDRWPSCMAFADALQQSAVGHEGEATNFFSFKLPPTPPPVPQRPPTPLPVGGTLTPKGPLHPRTDIPAPQKSQKSRLPWVIGGIGIVALAAVGMMAIGGASFQTPTQTPIAEAGLPTDTLSPRQIAMTTRDAQGTLDVEFTALAFLDETATAALFTETPTPTATDTPSDTPTFTFTPTDTATRLPTRTPTFTNSPTRTITPTRTSTSTRTPTLTRTPTSTRTIRPTRTPRPTASNTPRPIHTRTPIPTRTPSRTIQPTLTNTPRPIRTRTPIPSRTPSRTPTLSAVKIETASVSRLFLQNFTTDTNGITRRLGGVWERRTVEGAGVNEQAYCNSGQPHSDTYDLLYWGSEGWDNYILEVDVRFLRASHIELYARYDGTSALNAYRAYVNSGEDSASLAYYGPRDVALGGKSYNFANNVWYTIRVELRGRLIRYWVEDTLIASTRNGERLTGYAGILVYSGDAICIDNVRVWDVSEPTNARYAVTRTSANLRSGPSVSYNVAETLEEGASVIAIGRTSDGLWLKVRTLYGIEAWVSTNLINLPGIVQSLPVMTP